MFALRVHRRRGGLGRAAVPPGAEAGAVRRRARAAGSSRSLANAVKFEQFIFDTLPLARRSLVLETSRAAEFEPLKNAAGDVLARDGAAAAERRRRRRARAGRGDRRRGGRTAPRPCRSSSSPLVAADPRRARAAGAAGHGRRRAVRAFVTDPARARAHTCDGAARSVARDAPAARSAPPASLRALRPRRRLRSARTAWRRCRCSAGPRAPAAASRPPRRSPTAASAAAGGSGSTRPSRRVAFEGRGRDLVLRFKDARPARARRAAAAGIIATVVPPPRVRRRSPGCPADRWRTIQRGLPPAAGAGAQPGAALGRAGAGAACGRRRSGAASAGSTTPPGGATCAAPSGPLAPSPGERIVGRRRRLHDGRHALGLRQRRCAARARARWRPSAWPGSCGSSGESAERRGERVCFRHSSVQRSRDEAAG